MSAHRIGVDLLLASNSGELTLPDPGDAGTIKPTRSPQICELVSGGAETRTVADPDGPMQILVLSFKTDGGDVTVTFSNTINTTGNNTATYADAGDTQVLVSASDGTTAFHWREVSNDGAALSTV